MIVKRKMIVSGSEYKRELSALSVCEFYKCKYRNLEGRCIDRSKQQCVDCETLNFDGYNRRHKSYFYIHQ